MSNNCNPELKNSFNEMLTLYNSIEDHYTKMLLRYSIANIYNGNINTFFFVSHDQFIDSVIMDDQFTYLQKYFNYPIEDNTEKQLQKLFNIFISFINSLINDFEYNVKE